MKILGWIFILIGLVDFVLSFIGLNLTPFFPNALSKFTPIVFGFIGGLLIKNAAKQKESSNKKKLEIFNIFKTKIIELGIYLNKRKKSSNKKKIYVICFALILFTAALAGYNIYQDKNNEKLLAIKTKEERIERNKKDIIEIINNSRQLELAKKKARESIENDFERALTESKDARSYCRNIHSQPSLRVIIEREECVYAEKLLIFKKYRIDYDRTIAILDREFYELETLATNYTKNVILGNRYSENDYTKAANEIRVRAIEQLIYEKDKFANLTMQKLEQKFNSSSSTKAKKGGSGSAFFINSKGNIVTNNHVVEVCSGNIKIIHNKKESTASLIAKDEKLDLAVLSSDIKPQQFLKLSKKSGEKLDKVVTAGYPLGYKISDELKFTAGIVSATKGWKDNINEIQIDAALNPGNSGGPVVNDAGNLFGVAVAGLTDRQNLNFAIKSKAVKDFLDVNKVSYSTAAMEFDMENKKRLKLLEDSTVFIYCR
jgi:hypothetical protein